MPLVGDAAGGMELSGGGVLLVLFILVLFILFDRMVKILLLK